MGDREGRRECEGRWMWAVGCRFVGFAHLVVDDDTWTVFLLAVNGHGRREAELGLFFGSSILLLLSAHGLTSADDCGYGGDGEQTDDHVSSLFSEAND